MAETTPHLGIDFGAANCVMTWFNPVTKQAETLLNAEGQFQTPAAVYYGPGGEVRVGAPALAMLPLQEEQSRVIRRIRRDFAVPARYPVPGAPTRLDAIIAMLRKLKQDAETGHFRRAVTRVTLAHSAMFDVLERDKLKEAARAAGFRQVTLIEAPVCAARALVWAGRQPGDTLLVYDQGATALDLALLKRNGKQGDYRIAMPPQTLAVGGDDFDAALYHHADRSAMQQLGRGLRLDGRFDPAALDECRCGKERLTTSHSTWLQFCLALEDGSEPLFRLDLCRELFADLIAPLLERMVRFTRSMLQQAQTLGHSIDSLLMIGGSAHMPLLREALREAMPDMIHIQEMVDPDYVVAYGTVLPHRLPPHRRRVSAGREPATHPIAPMTAASRMATSRTEALSRPRLMIPHQTTGEIAQFADHPGRVNSVAFSPDGRFALSASESRQAVDFGLSDTFSGPLYTLPHPARKMLMLRDLAQGKSVVEFTGVREAVRKAAFSPEGTRIFALDGHETLHVWEAAANGRYGVWRKTRWAPAGCIPWRNVWEWEEPQADSAPVARCALSADGALLLAAAATPHPAASRGRADLWDARNGEWLLAMGAEGGFPYINGLAFSPDGAFAAISYQMDGKGAGHVALCRVADGMLLQTAKLEAVVAEPIFSAERIQFSPTGRFLLLCGPWDFMLWDVFYWQQVQSFYHTHAAAITSTAFTPDGRHIVSTAKDGALRFWEVYSGKQIRIHHASEVPLSCAAVSPDGRSALCGGEDGIVRLITLPEFT